MFALLHFLFALTIWYNFDFHTLHCTILLPPLGARSSVTILQLLHLNMKWGTFIKCNVNVPWLWAITTMEHRWLNEYVDNIINVNYPWSVIIYRSVYVSYQPFELPHLPFCQRVHSSSLHLENFEFSCYFEPYNTQIEDSVIHLWWFYNITVTPCRILFRMFFNLHLSLKSVAAPCVQTYPNVKSDTEIIQLVCMKHQSPNHLSLYYGS